MIANKNYILYKYFLLLVLVFNGIFIYNDSKILNSTNIPELNYYNHQTLNYLSQSKKCPFTLFLFSDYRLYNSSFKIKKINLRNKDYFVTYFEYDSNYEDLYERLKNNGFIKSNYKYGKHNLFISQLFYDYFAGNDYKIYDLDKFQKVYRYFGCYYVFNKNIFYEFYVQMKKKFFDEFNYMPETFIYPEQKNLIFDKFKNYTIDLNDLWLVKPKDKYGGMGITFLNSLETVELKEYVITKYITNINLINGKKYDLRLYALIAGLKPLRIYFYDEGSVRIATENYTLNKSSISNKYMYLTNVDININNKNYIKPNTINDFNANMYNILMYKKYLKSLNIEYFDIKEKIKDLIIKSIISVYKKLNEENEKLNVHDRSFFNILGFDILINDKFEPILVEINFNPDMKIHSILQKEIKSNLFVDTLNLIGIILYSKKLKEPINKKSKFKREIDDNINNAFCELERPRGSYELIFPKKENINKYKKYFIYNTEENEIFWSKLTS